MIVSVPDHCLHLLVDLNVDFLDFSHHANISLFTEFTQYLHLTYCENNENVRLVLC